MSYFDHDGYDLGYDGVEAPSSPQSNSVQFQPEGVVVRYECQLRVCREGENPVEDNCIDVSAPVEPDSLPGLGTAGGSDRSAPTGASALDRLGEILGGTGSADPEPATSAGDAHPETATGSGDALDTAGADIAPADAPVTETPAADGTGAADGGGSGGGSGTRTGGARRRPRVAATPSLVLPEHTPFETRAIQTLGDERHGRLSLSTSESYLELRPMPRGGEEAYLRELEGLDAAGVHDYMGEALLRDHLESCHTRGYTPAEAYAEMEAMGMIAPGQTPPDAVNWPDSWDVTNLPDLREGLDNDDLARLHHEADTLQGAALPTGSAARHTFIADRAARLELTRRWIESMEAQGWSRERAVGALEHMEHPLMRGGEVQSFDVLETAPLLFTPPAGETDLLDAEGRLRTDAQAIVPGSAAPEAEAVTAATATGDGVASDLTQIHDDLSFLGMTESEIDAITASRTRFGGPLTEADGDRLPDVTADQIHSYAETLHARVAGLRARSAEAEHEAGPRGDRARAAIGERRERLAGRVRDEAESYYQDRIAGTLRTIGLNADRIIRYETGEGYLGDNPDLAEMAADYERLSAIDSGGRAAERRRLTALIDGDGAYVLPTGDGPEATRAAAIRSSMSTRAGSSSGAAATGAPNFEDQMTLQESQNEAQEEMAELNHDLELIRQDSAHEDRAEEGLLNTAGQSLFQLGNQKNQEIADQTKQSTQAIWDGTNELLRIIASGGQVILSNLFPSTGSSNRS